jgi:magnesium transporter
VLDANLSLITLRQNEVVRAISGWAAIIALPTFIASVYGMNFDHMPELRWRFGYPAVILVILLICGGLWRYFKKVGWL